MTPASMKTPQPLSQMRPSIRFALFGFLGLFGLSLIGHDIASAQTRRPVRQGEVQGIELSLEGGTRVVRGDTLRWVATAYEVVGLDQLRPAAGARIVVATSLNDESLEFEADRSGRVMIAIPVPEDAPAGFGVTMNARAPRGVSRRFELRVQTEEYRTLTLFPNSGLYAPGTLAVVGRAARRDGRALPGLSVRLRIRDNGGPLGPVHTVVADQRGLFEASIAIPRRAQGAITVEATTAADEDGRTVVATSQVPLLAEPPTSLLVQVRPRDAIVLPGTEAELDVIVRRPDGRPVEGAVVSSRGQTVLRAIDIPEREATHYAVTDGRGGAVLRVRQQLGAGVPFNDRVLRVTAGAEGIGQGAGSTTIRVSPHRFMAAMRIEGSALGSQNLTSQIYALVSDMRGQVAAGQTVRLRGNAIGAHELRSSEHGLAVFDVRVDRAAAAEDCGGPHATEVHLVVAGAPPLTECVPIDNDQSTRGRVTRWDDDHLEVQVQRRADVARAPTLVTLHRTDGAPVAMVELRPGEDTARLETRGQRDLFVRTRALFGSERRPVRGSVVRVLPLEEPSISLDGRGDHTGMTIQVRHDGRRDTVLLAAPLQHSPGLARPTDAVLARLLTVGTLGGDDAAPYVLRNGRPTATPAPESAPTLLRDPWRSSERFVSGRLALIFRAIENLVDQSVPGSVDQVATENGGRLRLKASLISALDTSALGAEGATGLGGESLTIADLQRMDRTFEYDAVATRITRRRLFGLLLALRDFVRERSFDLPWARPGDPSHWLRPLAGRYVAGFGSVDTRALADGWGRPFRLERTGRARYDQVQPVAGYELVSAGPDGRFGTRDDIRDPTARALRSGTLYATAVGEDDLVARLGGVELGRASAQALADALGFNAYNIAHHHVTRTTFAGGAIPSQLPDTTHALSLVRPSARFRPLTSRGQGAERRLEAGTEALTWLVRAYGVDETGVLTATPIVVRAGAEIFASAPLPSRLLTGQPFISEMHITNVGRTTERFHLVGTSERLAIEVPSEVEVPGGETRTVAVTLTARTPGTAQAEIQIQVADQTEGGRTIRHRLEASEGLHPIRRIATGVGPFRTTLRVPRNATRPTTRVVVLSGPSLSHDPDLEETEHQAPGLIAWSRVMAGQPLGDNLVSAILRDSPSDTLSLAPTIIALATLVDDQGEADPRAVAKRRGLVSALGSAPSLPDTSPAAGTLRGQALTLAALAASGAPARSQNADPVRQQLIALQRQVRGALEDNRAYPTLLARGAAALLLLNPQDAIGQAMFALAKEHLVAHEGFTTLPGGEDRPGRIEEGAATLSLAIAAHQLGERTLARTLLHGAAQNVRSLTATPSEGTFWWLAAGAYGVFGNAPSEAVIHVDGQAHTVDLGVQTSGVGVLPLDADGGARLRITHESDPTEGLLFLRAESVFARPFDGNDEGHFELSLEGEVGRQGQDAGLELVVRARDTVGSPIIDIQLPAGIEADDALLARLTATQTVLRAERRSPGFVRLTLTGLEQQTERRIPLPLPWRSPSSVRGLGAVAYASGEPHRMSILAPRELTPEEPR